MTGVQTCALPIWFMIGAGTLPANDGVINFQLLGADPGASAVEGTLYYNNTDHEFRYHDGAGWRPFSSICLRRQFNAGSGNIQCPAGYHLAGIAYDTTEHTETATYFDNPLPGSGQYLCCPFCNDFDNDGACD